MPAMRLPESAAVRAWARRNAVVRRVHGKLWAVRSYWRPMLARPGFAASFLLLDPEVDNYTYEIANAAELATFVAQVCSSTPERAWALIRELEEDAEFRNSLALGLGTRRDRKRVPQYGRRAGWYAIVRLLRPALVIEAGVHDGLGSSVLLAALHRNHKDGFEGQLFGIDVDITAGWLIPEALRNDFNFVHSDSVEALSRVGTEHPIDLFIHDSLHIYPHEMQEYRAVHERLSSRGTLLSDNAHVTSALHDFSVGLHRPYFFWHEVPIRHFYPGAGIGASLPPGTVGMS